MSVALTTAQADDVIRHASRTHVVLFEKDENLSQWFADSSGLSAYSLGQIKSEEFVDRYTEFLASSSTPN